MVKHCLNYQQKGYCNFGKKCKFLHEVQSADDKWYETISKFLSNVLRHKASEFGITLREDGYASIDSILALPYLVKREAQIKDIRHVVDANEKKRFAIATIDGVEYIRANQGHTIATVRDEALLGEAITQDDWKSIEDCYHGTYTKNLESIKRDGLRSMGRNHIHFAHAGGQQGAAISGMREDCDVKLVLDVETCMRDGITFHRSSNGVVLTKGLHDKGFIPYSYFKEEVPVEKYMPNLLTTELSAQHHHSSSASSYHREPGQPRSLAPSVPYIPKPDDFPPMHAVDTTPKRKNRWGKRHPEASDMTVPAAPTCKAPALTSASLSNPKHSDRVSYATKKGKKAPKNGKEVRDKEVEFLRRSMEEEEREKDKKTGM